MAKKKIEIAGGTVDLRKEEANFKKLKKRLKRIAEGKPILLDFKYKK